METVEFPLHSIERKGNSVLSRLLWLAALIGYISTNAFAGQAAEKPVQPVPVSKEFLDGTKLLLKGAGCTIAPPSSGWNWMTYDKSGQNFICVNAKTLEIYGVGLETLKSEMTDHHPQSLIASAKKTQEARGGKLEKDVYEFIDIPGAKKAARVTFTEIDKAGKKTLAVIYVINTRDLTVVKIHCNGPYTSEPDAFKAMVKSLKITPG
jgi:hypothetical protein